MANPLPILYVNKEAAGLLNIGEPTKCLSSMTYFSYLKCNKKGFIVMVDNKGTTPRLVFDDKVYSDIEQNILLIFEPPVTPTVGLGLGVANDEILYLPNLQKFSCLEKSFLLSPSEVQKMGEIFKALREFQIGSLYELYRHYTEVDGPGSWASTQFLLMRQTMGINDHNEEGKRTEMMSRAIVALEALSMRLGWRRAFLQYQKRINRSLQVTIAGISMDLKTTVDSIFLSTALIVKNMLRLSPLYDNLMRMLNLRAYMERFECKHMPKMAVANIPHQIYDGQVGEVGYRIGTGLIFMCEVGPHSEVPLQPGRYVVKTSYKYKTDDRSVEISMHYRLPYPTMTQLVGIGVRPNGRRFLVFKAYASDLMTRILEPGGNPLTWKSAMKILIQVAYALQQLHAHYRQNRLAFVDVNSRNVLLDDNDNAILCDLEAIRTEGEQDTDTQAGFRDDKTYHLGANQLGDICSLAAIMVQMFTNDFDPGKFPTAFRTRLMEIGAENMIRGPLRDSGCIGPRATGIIELAIACCSDEWQGRPKAYQVLERLEFLRDLDMNF